MQDENRMFHPIFTRTASNKGNNHNDEGSLTGAIRSFSSSYRTHRT